MPHQRISEPGKLFLVVADTTDLVTDLRVESLLLEGLVRAGSRPLDNMISIAKNVVSGMPTVHSKKDFHDAITKLAEAERLDGETDAQAYTRIITKTEDGRLLYSAYRLAAHGDQEVAAAPVAAPMPPSTPSYDRLMKKAEELHKSEPSLTREQAFTKIYTDPRHGELVKAAKAERTEQYTSTGAVAELRKREGERAA